MTVFVCALYVILHLKKRKPIYVYNIEYDCIRQGTNYHHSHRCHLPPSHTHTDTKRTDMHIVELEK